MEILELLLLTAKPDEQKSFYSGKLGFELLNESGNSFTVKAGNSKLTFTHNKNSAENYYHFALNIPENQLDKAMEWLKQFTQLIEYDGSPVIDFPNWNAHSVYFYDPAGNIVELIARHNLDNASEENFSALSIINISEVGIPVKSVEDFYEVLNKKLGLNLWYGNLETFAAIGDEEGLFIVVTTARNWFPTDKPCNIYPLEIKIQSNKTITIDNADYKIITEPANYIP